MFRIVVLCLMLASSALTAQDKRASVVTNGELTPGKNLHLLLIHDGSQFAAQIAAMLNQPQSQMIQWVQGSNVRLMAVNEPQVMEHHADLVEKHQGQLPILAMIEQSADDGRGAVWCSAAAGQIPQSESAMASWLGRYYAATLQAKAKANYLQPRQQEMQRTAFPTASDSYFLPRNSAPEPYSPTGGRRRPFFNPQLDVTVPDAINTTVGMNPDTQRTLIFVGVLAIVCCLLLFASPIISAVIIGHAITDDDDRSRPSPPSAVNV